MIRMNDLKKDLVVTPDMQQVIDDINGLGNPFDWPRQPRWRYSRTPKDLSRDVYMNADDISRRKALIKALVEPIGSAQLQKIGLQILHCTVKAPCGSPLCNRCRTEMQNKTEDKALRFFSSSNHSDLYFLTVIDELTYNPVQDMAKSWGSLKRRLKDCFKDPAVKNKFTAYGLFEVDVKVPQQTQVQHNFLKLYGWTQSNNYGFMPHFHAIVDLQGNDPGEFRKHLRKTFTRLKQVMLKPYDTGQSQNRNIRSLSRYMCKFRYQYADNVIVQKSTYKNCFEPALLRQYTELTHEMMGNRSLRNFEFFHRL